MNSDLFRRLPVGIEKLWVYEGQTVLDLRDLARARGENPDHPTKFLLVDKRTVNPAFEDPTTMAVNAANPILTDRDRADIELLVVATESSADYSKPISTFVQKHLKINENCRNFEVKHACYGGTGALMMAAHWVASSPRAGAKALVIASDESRRNFGERYEYLMGAVAVAILVSAKPEICEIELNTCSYWTKEVGDTFRPTSTVDAGNTDASLYCYLEALDGAYNHFCRRNPDIDYLNDFKAHIYHVPFGGMALRAHRSLMKLQQRSCSKQEICDSFEDKVKDGLIYTRQFAGLYGSSTFVGLLGQIDGGRLEESDQVSIYAYGSGAQSEMYAMRIGGKARQFVRKSETRSRLNQRFSLTVQQYELLENERASYIDRGSFEPRRDSVPGLWDAKYAGKNLLYLQRVDEFFRHYKWS